MAKKVYRKTLTNSGGGVCTLTGFAAVFALAAAAGDFIAGAVYTQFYKNQVYDMTPDPIEYIRDNNGGIVMGLFALIMFIWALTAAKGRRMGREFGWLGIFMGLGLTLSPAVKLYEIFDSDLMSRWFDTAYDSDKFRGAAELAKAGLPALAGLLLLIAGIIVLARIGGEDFEIEAPRAAKKAEAPKPEKPMKNDARGFGENTQQIQGLTGETKPATYGEKEEAPAAVKEGSPAPAPRPAKKATVKLCPNCGELVGEDELFCSNCGQKM